MSSYDAFAWFYDRYWAAPFQKWEMPAIESLALNYLKTGAAVLDLCCGVGHLARELSGRGFAVTGVDSSVGMLEIARHNAPTAQFLSQNASEFSLNSPVDAVLCTFDSVNHVHTPDAILASFRQIRKSLNPGGLFVFDFNSPEAYGERWDATYTVIEPDHAFFLRGRFDPVAQLGHTEITMFREQQKAWHRADASFNQRPWTTPVLSALLKEAGFRTIEHWRAGEDLGLEGQYGLGRVYIRAC